MTKFEEMDIDPRILRSLNEMGYTEAFPIQEKVQAPFMSGIDLIGQAKTGSGKTAAFGLPLLHLVNPSQREVQALILAPTRELAVQITKEIEKLAKYTGTKAVTIYGGQSINVQIDALLRRPHIVVGTPGRVIDLIKRRSLNLSKVRYVVLDEADRMLDMGFIDDIEFILEATPGRRQMSLFSATMPREILDLARRYMSNPQKILISADEPSVEELDQYYTVVDDGSKQDRLVEILKSERPSSAIVFCRTKIGAHRLARDLEKRYFNVVPLHGDLSQYQRDASMNAFRAGQVEILVATDVAARGIDVPGVQLVVNYDFPDDPLVYFHRVGRTARAGSSGKSISIIQPDDFPNFYRAQHLTKTIIKPLTPLDEQKALHPNTRRQQSSFIRYGGSRPYRRTGYQHAWQSYRRR